MIFMICSLCLAVYLHLNVFLVSVRFDAATWEQVYFVKHHVPNVVGGYWIKVNNLSCLKADCIYE